MIVVLVAISKIHSRMKYNSDIGDKTGGGSKTSVRKQFSTIRFKSDDFEVL